MSPIYRDHGQSGHNSDVISNPEFRDRQQRSWAVRLAPPLVMILMMWLCYVIQVVVGPEVWRGFGIPAGGWDRLWSIVTAPFLHGGIMHLINNTIAMIWLGIMTAVEGPKRFWAVTITAAIVSGIGVIMLSAPGSVTVGMSGVIFGYFGYILVAAFVEQNRRHKAVRIVSLAVFFMWWGTTFFAGFIPQGNMSWQAHLFGALGGGLVAIITERREARAMQP